MGWGGAFSEDELRGSPPPVLPFAESFSRASGTPWGFWLFFLLAWKGLVVWMLLVWRRVEASRVERRVGSFAGAIGTVLFLVESGEFSMG